ncbi:hypothetical protein BVRB_7g160980 isoform A [Beta vulgaris subsp. vulgaris]|nr:hypothetical protein BVRB_7g160980 isoform A [Beta vulgaris subsp. vulgaris]
MDDPKKHLVSLRGASAREITRGALLEKVSHERELRNFARRASSAALFIQRVWRRYNVSVRVALEFQKEWNRSVHDASRPMKKTWISCSLLRPFLFSVTHLSLRRCTIQTQAVNSMRSCFVILLENLNSTDQAINFCSLAIGTIEEQRTWSYQVKKLVSLCSFVLADYDNYSRGSCEVVSVTALLMRLVINLTDSRGWKCISGGKCEDADRAVKDVIRFIGSDKSGVYRSIGRYMTKLDASCASQSVVQKDDTFLITASAITLVLRPFLASYTDGKDSLPLDIQCAAEQYCLFILTVPWLVQRIPAVLLRALRHTSTLLPCFETLLILSEQILLKYSRMDQSGASDPNYIPHVGWTLSNIISLVTGSENKSIESSNFTDGIDIVRYVNVLNLLAERFLTQIESNRFAPKERQAVEDDGKSAAESYTNFAASTFESLNYMDLLRPVCQQWHLSKLMVTVKGNVTNESDSYTSKSDPKHIKVLQLLDIAHYYSYMIRIYSALNRMLGPLPVLNMLSFTPGFLVSIWGILEHALFPEAAQASGNDLYHTAEMYGNKSAGTSKRKQKRPSKDGAAKWVNVFHKISGKSQTDAANSSDGIDGQVVDNQGESNLDDQWDVESLRFGLDSISKENLCLIHLFCASYAHLLLVLDDIEFYEKQVPFTLEQQRRIASMLNTLVYNGLLHNTARQNKPIMDAASRCLQMLYERDCRHRFCPPALWLSPARKSRPPIAMAARTHEVQLDVKSDDSLAFPSMGSFITVTPHVYPFEERVQIFREFIKMDKTSRRMAGELNAPGDRSIAIVVRRSHLIEDGFEQLNSLGTRLKSSIHVSFVSECGLPEAGLDYGGLSKEFLTDISKAAFDPQHQLPRDC